jgi:predicted Fe-S protein YdhL (DUF1289 family)
MAISDTDSTVRVQSPCIRHCTLDDADICLGCFRRIDEICAWGGATNEQRNQILITAESRAKEKQRV